MDKWVDDVTPEEILLLAADISWTILGEALDELIGDLLPMSRTNAVALDELGLTADQRRALLRNCFIDLLDVSELSPRQLWEMSNVGADGAWRILVGLVLIGLGHSPVMSADQPSMPRESVRAESAPVVGRRKSAQRDRAATVANAQDAILEVAEWLHYVGRPGDGVLSAESVIPLRRIEQLRRFLRVLAPADLIPAGDVPTPALELNLFFGPLTDREVDVLTARRILPQSETLEVVGARHGVTRERIRQIERNVTEELARHFEASGKLLELAQAMEDLVDRPTPLSVLLAELPVLADKVNRIDQPVWRVLKIAAPSVIVEGDWLVPVSLQGAIVRTQDALTSSTSAGLISLSWLEENCADVVRGSFKDALAWVAGPCGVRVVGEHLLIGASGAPDLAALALTKLARPASVEEIKGALDMPQSVASIRNALGVDERFTRADKGLWALSSWGLDEYTNVRQVIGDLLRENQGEMHLASLVTEVTSRFNVAASSVEAYARSRPYSVQRGVVRLHGGVKAKRPSRKLPRRVYRRGNELLLRLAVTGDHLRGSGFPVGIGLVEALGVPPGERRTFSGSAGDVRVSWVRQQPSCGSIRSYLMELGSQPDDVVLACFAEASFHVERVDLPPDSDPQAIIKALIGQPDAKDVRLALAEALDNPIESTWASLFDT